MWDDKVIMFNSNSCACLIASWVTWLLFRVEGLFMSNCMPFNVTKKST